MHGAASVLPGLRANLLFKARTAGSELCPAVDSESGLPGGVPRIHFGQKTRAGSRAGDPRAEAADCFLYLQKRQRKPRPGPPIPARVSAVGAPPGREGVCSGAPLVLLGCCDLRAPGWRRTPHPCPHLPAALSPHPKVPPRRDPAWLTCDITESLILDPAHSQAVEAGLRPPCGKRLNPRHPRGVQTAVEAVRGVAGAARARRPRRQTDPNRLCCPPEFLRRARAARPAAPGARVLCARRTRGPASAPRRAACCQARSGRGEASWNGPWCRPCPPRCRRRSPCGCTRPAHLFPR